MNQYFFDPLYISNSIFSCVYFVFVLIKFQKITRCIGRICSWILYLLLLMPVFTITQTYLISIVFLSLRTHVLYYMHYPFFLVCLNQPRSRRTIKECVPNDQPYENAFVTRSTVVVRSERICNVLVICVEALIENNWKMAVIRENSRYVEKMISSRKKYTIKQTSPSKYF